MHNVHSMLFKNAMHSSSHRLPATATASGPNVATHALLQQTHSYCQASSPQPHRYLKTA
jgi:hypothetical protein